MTLDVFISYGRRDHDKNGIVRRLCEAITALGYVVWWDRKIPPGVPYASHIAQKLKEARLVLVLWGEASATSRWVYEEAELAMAASKYVPLKLESCTIPLGFGTLQSIDFTNWDQNTDAPCFLELAAHLREMLGVGSAPEADARQRVLFSLMRAFGNTFGDGGFKDVHKWSADTKLSSVMNLEDHSAMINLDRVLANFDLRAMPGAAAESAPVMRITETTTMSDIVEEIMLIEQEYRDFYEEESPGWVRFEQDERE